MNGSQDGGVDEDWFNDWEYTLDDNYIYLVSIKEGINATKYTIPSKAKIDGSEYTTKINNGGILANSPVEELKLYFKFSKSFELYFKYLLTIVKYGFIIFE